MREEDGQRGWLLGDPSLPLLFRIPIKEQGSRCNGGPWQRERKLLSPFTRVCINLASHPGSLMKSRGY